LTKIVVPLYLICLFCYILFSRDPDYFDSEFAQATLVMKQDAYARKEVLKAEFSDGYKNYYVDDFGGYYSGHQPGDKITIIYEPKNPKGAKQYSFWEYWMTIQEFFWSLVLLAVSWSAAYSITQNPTPEALLEQLEYKEPDKPRYD
jgi:hypothetical protein